MIIAGDDLTILRKRQHDDRTFENVFSLFVQSCVRCYPLNCHYSADSTQKQQESPVWYTATQSDNENTMNLCRPLLTPMASLHSPF